MCNPCFGESIPLPSSLSIFHRVPHEFPLSLQPSSSISNPRSLSLARRHHPGPGRRPRHLGHLLPLGLAAAAQDLCPVLGLLAALGRGAPHHHQQVQHGAAARARRPDHHGAPGARRPGHAVDHHAVSLCLRHASLSAHLSLCLSLLSHRFLCFRPKICT